MHVAVLGTGGMGRTVIKTLKENRRVERIVGYDLAPQRLAEADAECPAMFAATTNLDEILGDASIRLVFITASNAAHAELALKSLEAGKAVMCEKPMANTLADAAAMVRKAEAFHGFLQIGFEARYSTLYEKIKRWIDAGLLGDIVNTHCYYINSEFHHKGSWRNLKAGGGGMFGEKLSHYVDLPRWWIGSPVERVISTCAPNTIPYYEVRDNYHTTCRFQNGAVSHLTFMMGPSSNVEGDPLTLLDMERDNGHHLRYLVVGTKGCVESDVFRRLLRRWQFSDSPLCRRSDKVEEYTWTVADDHVHFHNTTDQTHDIVRRVEAGEPPRITPQDALETMRVCFAAEQSADSGEMVWLRDIAT